jgi:hypothetical protein
MHHRRDTDRGQQHGGGRTMMSGFFPQVARTNQKLRGGWLRLSKGEAVSRPRHCLRVRPDRSARGRRRGPCWLESVERVFAGQKSGHAGQRVDVVADPPSSISVQAASARRATRVEDGGRRALIARAMPNSTFIWLPWSEAVRLEIEWTMLRRANQRRAEACTIGSVSGRAGRLEAIFDEMLSGCLDNRPKRGSWSGIEVIHRRDDGELADGFASRCRAMKDAV